jgi:hypothetical protein
MFQGNLGLFLMVGISGFSRPLCSRFDHQSRKSRARGNKGLYSSFYNLVRWNDSDVQNLKKNVFKTFFNTENLQYIVKINSFLWVLFLCIQKSNPQM